MKISLRLTSKQAQLTKGVASVRFSREFKDYVGAAHRRYRYWELI